MTMTATRQCQVNNPLSLFIGGDWVKPSGITTFDVVDSATEELFMTVAEAQAPDIVRAVAADPASLNRQVSDFMTAHVITCGPHTSIPELMDEMTIGRFRHLPVVVDGRLAGLVSIGDVVKYRVAEIEAESRALRNYIATA